MIIGHKKQLDFLVKTAKKGKLPHAVLFSGQEELGKKTVAFQLFSSFFKGNLNSHPDFVFIEPETKIIQIRQIRNLQERISLKPVSAPFFGAIIDNAHCMTSEAQNCFLKTLEEPKTDSVLILISQYPRYLLPTILSRCQEVKFYPLERKEILAYLKKRNIATKEADNIAELSLGRPGRVIDFIDHAEKLENNLACLKEISSVLREPFSRKFDYAKDLALKDNLLDVLNCWIFYFRKKLLAAKDKLSFLKNKETLEALQETIYLISTTNINKRLALETLMIKI